MSKVIKTDGVYPEHCGYIVRDLTHQQVLETLDWKRPAVMIGVDVPDYVYLDADEHDKGLRWLCNAFLNKGYIMVEPPDEKGWALALYHHDAHFHLTRVRHANRNQ